MNHMPPPSRFVDFIVLAYHAPTYQVARQGGIYAFPGFCSVLSVPLGIRLDSTRLDDHNMM